jgi:hypothetical protein
MSRGEGAILGKFGGTLRGFNIRWATRLLRETPRADLFSVRAQRSSVGLLGQRQFFPTQAPLGRRAREENSGRANRRAPLHPAATLWERGWRVRATQNAHPPHAANSTDVPLSYQSPSRSSQKTAVDNPLQVPPAGRGTNPCAVPLAKRGEPAGGGNRYPLLPRCRQGEPNPCAVPLAKRGEPAGGGKRPLPPPTGSRCRRGNRTAARFPSKRGEPKGGGQLCPLSPPLRRS